MSKRKSLKDSALQVNYKRNEFLKEFDSESVIEQLELEKQVLANENDKLLNGIISSGKLPKALADSMLFTDLSSDLNTLEINLKNAEQTTQVSILSLGRMLNHLVENKLYKQKGFDNYKVYFNEVKPLKLSERQSRKLIDIWKEFGNAIQGQLTAPENFFTILFQSHDDDNGEKENIDMQNQIVSTLNNIGVERLSELIRIKDMETKMSLIKWIVEENPTVVVVKSKVKELLQQNELPVQPVESKNKDIEKQNNILLIGRKKVTFNKNIIPSDKQDEVLKLIKEILLNIESGKLIIEKVKQDNRQMEKITYIESDKSIGKRDNNDTVLKDETKRIADLLVNFSENNLLSEVLKRRLEQMATDIRTIPEKIQTQ